MLLKGIEEVPRAPDQLAAAEMVLIRMAYTADLPAPDELMRILSSGSGGSAPARVTTAPPPQPPRGVVNAAPMPAGRPVPERAAPVEAPAGPRSFLAVIELAGEKRDAMLRMHLEDHVSLVRFEPGRLEIRIVEGAPPNLAGEIAEKLTRWTGRRWIVAISRDKGQRPVGEVRREREAAELEELKRHPAVKSVLDAFPSADIKAVRPMKKESSGQ